MTEWEDMVLVGCVARPHGLRGHVVVDPETDFVDPRFAGGERLWMWADDAVAEMTIASSRLLGRRPIVGFAGRKRREEVEAFAGLELRVPEENLEALPEGRYYHHQLRGCLVETTAGDTVGRVARVDDGMGEGCLVVTGLAGEVLVPLANDICVEINVDRGHIRIEPPEGLLDLNVAQWPRGIDGSGA
jgi:16S rRNA processing protein RimM